MSSKHRLKTVGKLIIERVANLAAVAYNLTYDRGRLLYDNTTQQLYFGNSQSSSFKTVCDIPLDTIVLFEANTARLGYTLLTTLNDYVVYGTMGSSAGGEGGGTNKTGGTWTQPVHYHTMNSHTHTLSHYHNATHYHNVTASHSHRWVYYNAGQTYTWDSGANLITWTSGGWVGGGIGMVVQKSGNGHLDNLLGDFYTEYITPGVSTTSFNTSTEAPISTPVNTNTDSAAPVNTWRPAGLNYTRQQRT